MVPIPAWTHLFVIVLQADVSVREVRKKGEKMLIVLTVCKILSGECREVTIPLNDMVATPFQCAHAGQIALAQWQNVHPADRVKKYQCTTSDRYARPA